MISFPFSIIMHGVALSGGLNLVFDLNTWLGKLN